MKGLDNRNVLGFAEIRNGLNMFFSLCARIPRAGGTLLATKRFSN